MKIIVDLDRFINLDRNSLRSTWKNENRIIYRNGSISSYNRDHYGCFNFSKVSEIDESLNEIQCLNRSRGELPISNLSVSIWCQNQQVDDTRNDWISDEFGWMEICLKCNCRSICLLCMDKHETDFNTLFHKWHGKMNKWIFVVILEFLYRINHSWYMYSNRKHIIIHTFGQSFFKTRGSTCVCP